MNEVPNLEVRSLGECRYASPYRSDAGHRFISDAQRVRLEDEVGPDATDLHDALLEKAGPRARIFFEPSRTTAAIVTCGGLSPGLNNVIRSIVLELRENYGVGRVVGVRDGFRGLNPSQGRPLLELDGSEVKTIHHLGGTILGSSRGSQDVSVMADFIQDAGIDVLFCVGGDGTQRGACALSQAVRARNRDTAIVGIPKTIDNDIPYVWMSFGYATAVEIARQVVSAAFVEAAGAPNGVGLVRQRAAPRYWRIPPPAHRNSFRCPGHGAQPQVYRSELPDSRRAGQLMGSHSQRSNGSDGRSCGNGGEDRGLDRVPPRDLRPHSYPYCGRKSPSYEPSERHVVRGAGLHTAAAMVMWPPMVFVSITARKMIDVLREPLDMDSTIYLPPDPS